MAWLPLVKTAGGGGSWSSLIPQTGLVNAWPFDTSNTTSSLATDIIGGKNATLTNVTLLGSGPSSNLNNAGVFNGTSSIGTTTLANLPTSTFSLNIWIKAPTLNTNGRLIANDHTDADNNGFQLLSTSDWVLDIGNGTTFSPLSTSAPTAGVWQMVTFTYNGTTLTSYLNAVPSATNTFTGPITNGSVNIGFGNNPAYSGDFFTGNIAGVAIWNVALTAGQVTTIFGL